MSPHLPKITASSSAIDLADWLELSALADEDQNASLQDLVAELRRNGTVEAYVDNSQDIETSVDSRGESTEAVAESVFSEIEARSNAADSSYVYHVDDDYIQLKPEVDVTASTYVFQLLLSMEGVQEPADDRLFPERQFESLCLRALQEYLGGASRSRAFKFGWPREAPYSSFSDALNHTIRLLGEGGDSKLGLADQSIKDDKLDLVVSIPFGDGLASQLIAFGQCAAGADWKSKLDELNSTEKWCAQWMTDPPVVTPVKTFFIPHRIERDVWKRTSRRAGVLFERCRIASQLSVIDDDEFETAQRWIRRVLQTREFPASLLA